MGNSPLLAGDKRLSYSSASTLQNCTQKYYYYKIAGLAFDDDYEDNTEAFDLGKAFHYVLENSMHKYYKPKFYDLVDTACEAFKVDKKCLLIAMLLKYYKLHQESGLEAFKCEIEVSNDIFFGLIDAIMVDSDNHWWVVDLKTAANLSDTTIRKLHNDFQLNLYASFKDDIAKNYGLDPKLFMGCRYRVTTKSKLKQRDTESDNDFIKRVYSGIKSADIVIFHDNLDPKGAVKKHKKLYQLAEKLRSGKAKPEQNFSHCDSFFKPCQYWSQCHKHKYTECENLFNIHIKE